jgi:hypothetical protein
MLQAVIVCAEGSVKRVIVSEKVRKNPGVITTKHLSLFGARDICVGRYQNAPNPEGKEPAPNRRIAAMFGATEAAEGAFAKGDFMVAGVAVECLTIEDVAEIEQLASGPIRDIVDMAARWMEKHEDAVRTALIVHAAKMARTPEIVEKDQQRLEILISQLTKDFVTIHFSTYGGEGLAKAIEGMPPTWFMRRYEKNIYSIYGPVKNVAKAQEALTAGLNKLVEEKKISNWGCFDPNDPQISIPVEDEEEEEEKEPKPEPEPAVEKREEESKEEEPRGETGKQEEEQKTE